MRAWARCEELKQTRNVATLPAVFSEYNTVTALCMRVLFGGGAQEIDARDVARVERCGTEVRADTTDGIVVNLEDAILRIFQLEGKGQDAVTRRQSGSSLLAALGQVPSNYGALNKDVDELGLPAFFQRHFNLTYVDDVVFSAEQDAGKVQHDHRGLFAAVDIEACELVAEMGLPRAIDAEERSGLQMELKAEGDSTLDFCIESWRGIIFDETWRLLRNPVYYSNGALRLLLSGIYLGARRDEMGRPLQSLIKPRWYYMNNATDDDRANVEIVVSHASPLLCFFRAKRRISSGEELRWHYNQGKVRAANPTC